MNCSNCKREPEVFKTPEGQDAYWLILDEEDMAHYLMSDFSVNFKVCLDLEPKLKKGESAICVNCLEAYEPEEPNHV